MMPSYWERRRDHSLPWPSRMTSSIIGLVIRYEELPPDDFTFRLFSRGDGIVGQDGSWLDGENLDHSLPTGDGMPGGDYVVTFSTASGDLDQNGIYNVLDVNLLCGLIRIRLENPAFDYDKSGELDVPDMDVYLERIFSSGPGDVNLDGLFDSSDYVAVFQKGEYEDGLVGNSSWADGDWNCDGEFDSLDVVFTFQSGRYEQELRTTSNDLAAAVDWLFAHDPQDTSRSRKAGGQA